MASSEHVFGKRAGGLATSPLLLPISMALKISISILPLVWSLVHPWHLVCYWGWPAGTASPNTGVPAWRRGSCRAMPARPAQHGMGCSKCSIGARGQVKRSFTSLLGHPGCACVPWKDVNILVVRHHPRGGQTQCQKPVAVAGKEWESPVRAKQLSSSAERSWSITLNLLWWKFPRK